MSIFKDTFVPSIKKQLEIRQNAIEKREAKDILYLTKRSAWVRMTSSVNVNDKQGVPTNELAKQYVLQGGTLDKDGKTLKQGLGNSGESYSTQTPSGQPHFRGIRPMPGITGIDIQSKGAYGSLREIVIKFTAWDIKQLEDLEVLYMRPGYSVLVEWGWIPYLNNEGNLENNFNPFDILNINNTGESTQKPKEQIFSELFGKSTDGKFYNSKTKSEGYITPHYGNYDASYGFVMNYSWSARDDGGYNCSTTIITIGEVIQSLKVNYFSFYNTKYGSNGLISKHFPDTLIESSKLPDITRSYYKNILAGIFHELYEICSNSEGGQEENGYSFFTTKLSIETESQPLGTLQKYITLETLVKVFNDFVILSDKKTPLVSLSVYERQYIAKNKSNLDPLLALAHPLQISVDPSICLIKADFWLNDKIVPAGINDSVIGNVTIGGNLAGVGSNSINLNSGDKRKEAIQGLSYLSLLKDYFTSEDAEQGKIKNIYINLQFLYSLAINENLSAQDNKGKSEISLYDFFKNILDNISKSIGGINNFDLHVDPIDGIARIIDINYVDAKGRSEIYKNAFELQMHNLKSTVRSYKLESQIFQEQSNVIAIGAQVGNGALGTNANTLVEFNRGLLDRIIPKRLDPNTEIQVNYARETEDILRNLQDNLSTLYNCFSNYTTLGSPQYKLAEASQYKGALSSMINFYLSISNSDTKNRAIIPTKLSIEMDGIGGLVIGHVFKIPYDLLPKGYRGIDYGNQLGYIITSINHKVTGGDWITSLGAQTIILDDPRSSTDVKFQDLVLKENKDLVFNVNPITGQGEFINRKARDNANYLRTNVAEYRVIVKNSLDEAGDIEYGLSRIVPSIIKEIKKQIPDLSITISSGNDNFHKAIISYESRHAKGEALDISILPNNSSNIQKVENILYSFVKGNDNFAFINEYTSRTKFSTGGHFHLSYGQFNRENGTAANLYTTKARSSQAIPIIINI